MSKSRCSQHQLLNRSIYSNGTWKGLPKDNMEESYHQDGGCCSGQNNNASGLERSTDCLKLLFPANDASRKSDSLSIRCGGTWPQATESKRRAQCQEQEQRPSTERSSCWGTWSVSRKPPSTDIRNRTQRKELGQQLSTDRISCGGERWPIQGKESTADDNKNTAQYEEVNNSSSSLALKHCIANVATVKERISYVERSLQVMLSSMDTSNDGKVKSADDSTLHRSLQELADVRHRVNSAEMSLRQVELSLAIEPTSSQNRQGFEKNQRDSTTLSDILHGMGEDFKNVIGKLNGIESFLHTLKAEPSKGVSKSGGSPNAESEHRQSSKTQQEPSNAIKGNVSPVGQTSGNIEIDYSKPLSALDLDNELTAKQLALFADDENFAKLQLSTGVTGMTMTNSVEREQKQLDDDVLMQNALNNSSSFRPASCTHRSNESLHSSVLLVPLSLLSHNSHTATGLPTSNVVQQIDATLNRSSFSRHTTSNAREPDVQGESGQVSATHVSDSTTPDSNSHKLVTDSERFNQQTAVSPHAMNGAEVPSLALKPGSFAVSNDVTNQQDADQTEQLISGALPTSHSATSSSNSRGPVHNTDNTPELKEARSISPDTRADHRQSHFQGSHGSKLNETLNEQKTSSLLMKASVQSENVALKQCIENMISRCQQDGFYKKQSTAASNDVANLPKRDFSRQSVNRSSPAVATDENLPMPPTNLSSDSVTQQPASKPLSIIMVPSWMISTLSPAAASNLMSQIQQQEAPSEFYSNTTVPPQVPSNTKQFSTRSPRTSALQSALPSDSLHHSTAQDVKLPRHYTQSPNAVQNPTVVKTSIESLNAVNSIYSIAVIDNPEAGGSIHSVFTTDDLWRRNPTWKPVIQQTNSNGEDTDI
jgi:hypothetical protein